MSKNLPIPEKIASPIIILASYPSVIWWTNQLPPDLCSLKLMYLFSNKCLFIDGNFLLTLVLWNNIKNHILKHDHIIIIDQVAIIFDALKIKNSTDCRLDLLLLFIIGYNPVALPLNLSPAELINQLYSDNLNIPANHRIVGYCRQKCVILPRK